MAVLVTRAASSRLAWLRSRATGSRTTALRRRSLAERRLVTGFVLSLVVVAAVFADARPLAPLGTADSAGIGEAGAIAGLDGFSGFVADRAPVGAERVDSVDAGGTVDTTSVDEVVATAGNQGAPYLPDGTLLKPVAIDAELPNLLRSDVVTYTVRSGDTLTGIAVRFHVSMSTLWWANKLSSKDSLHVGQELVIPPVSGILWTVEEGDTLESVAAETKGSVDDIKAFNGLTSDTLIIGMQLMVPGGKGAPIPTPKPVAPSRPAGGGYGGHGILRWPVDGGYISQYYWSGHRAIDIAATSGTRVFAAAYGRVAWAGWRNNCGGYQIWIDHGNGMWTTYNHLSAILVGAGTYVGRGQTIGRIGESGCATGPHLHFAVWRGGAPWTTGAYEVNPLNYI
jgi:murein DD-endopeptidase MepM/ murein hydrolase activator NlpD